MKRRIHPTEPGVYRCAIDPGRRVVYNGGGWNGYTQRSNRSIPGGESREYSPYGSSARNANRVAPIMPLRSEKPTRRASQK